MALVPADGTGTATEQGMEDALGEAKAALRCALGAKKTSESDQRGYVIEYPQRLLS